MATSTSTLLTVVNRVLINANERTIANTTTLIGQQVKESIRMALLMLASTGHWAWTEDRINATSWSSGVATLPTNVSLIRSVAWDNDDGVLIPLRYVQRQVFDQIVADSYNSNTGRALWYTITDTNVVRVNPYPTTVGEQNKIWFYVVETIDLPASDAGTFPIPEEFIPTLVVMATQFFLKRDQEDYLDVAMQELNRKLTRNMRTPQTEMNLYRGWRNYGY